MKNLSTYCTEMYIIYLLLYYCICTNTINTTTTSIKIFTTTTTPLLLLQQQLEKNDDVKYDSMSFLSAKYSVTTIPSISSTIYSAMSSSWKLPRDVLGHRRTVLQILPSEVLLKRFEGEEDFDVDRR